MFQIWNLAKNLGIVCGHFRISPMRKNTYRTEQFVSLNITRIMQISELLKKVELDLYAHDFLGKTVKPS